MKRLLLNIQKFAKDKFKTNVEDLLKKHTAEDGAVDFAKINETLNVDIDKYNSSKQPDMEALKTKHKQEFENDFFKGLGIDGVTTADGFKTHADTISKSTDTNAKEVTRLTGELTKLTDINKGWETKYNDAFDTSKTNKFKADVYENGFDPKYLNSVKAEFEPRFKKAIEGKDDYDVVEIEKEIYGKIKEDFPAFLGETKKVDQFGNKKPGDNDKRENAFGNKKSGDFRTFNK